MRIKHIVLSILAIFILSVSLPSWAQQKNSNTTVLRIVSLLDYIAGDYHNAIASEGGKILSADEYSEMNDFSGLIDHYIKLLDKTPPQELITEWEVLHQSIQDKKSPTDVEEQASRLKKKFIQDFAISTTPAALPNLLRGKELFQSNCMVCHGADGRAQTPTAKQLDPSPVAFADPEILNVLSPFKAYNILTFGVDKTAMASFSGFSEEDRWALASYVFLFRNQPPKSGIGQPLIGWQKAMALTDNEIIADLKKQGLDQDKIWQQLSQIRNLSYPSPAKNFAEATDSTSANDNLLKNISLAKKQIEQSVEAFKKSHFDQALDLAVTAYLDGFESAEAFLRSAQRADLVSSIEKDFIQYRQAIREHQNNTVDLGNALITHLNEVQIFLKEQQSLSPQLAFTASYMIVVREGMEAILLLAIIFSVLGNLKESRLQKWVHISWIAALLVGWMTWFVASEIITGAMREGLEGWVSLIAAMVLLYVSFWLIAKRDVEKWKRFLMGKIKSRRQLGFYTVASVAFLAVYREVFESILFFEALRLQALGQSSFLSLGVVLGFITLALLALVIFKLGKKIPLNIFFGVSGFTLYMLAVVFIGEGIHSLQEANIFSQTLVLFFTLPALGIFPSLEGVGAQGFLFALFVGGLVWQQWIKRPTQEKDLETKIDKVSLDLFDIHEIEEHLKEHLHQLKSKFEHGLGSSKAEIQEMLGHMHDLDQGIHHLISQLSQFRSEIPERFDEIYQEIQNLEDGKDHQTLVTQAKNFKMHLESLKK